MKESLFVFYSSVFVLGIIFCIVLSFFWGRRFGSRGIYREMSRALHDIKNTVSAVVGMTDVFASLYSGEKPQKPFDTAKWYGRVALEEITAIFEDCAFLAKKSRGSELTNVSTVLREMCLMGKNGQGIDFLGEAYAPVNIRRLHLVRIAGNLMDNAEKYGGCEGVEVRLCGRRCLISVTGGAEIPPKKRKYVFKDGARIPGESPGHGLGLGIVKSLAERYAGRVYSSFVNGVMRFTVDFPVGRPHAHKLSKKTDVGV